MNAGIYMRVSARAQLEFGTSLDTQEALCKAAATAAGYTVSDHHIWRETHSGATLDRPVLSHVKEAARRRLIDAIWIYTWDRLARNALDLTSSQKLATTEYRFGLRPEPPTPTPRGNWSCSSRVLSAHRPPSNRVHKKHADYERRPIHG